MSEVLSTEVLPVAGKTPPHSRKVLAAAIGFLLVGGSALADNQRQRSASLAEVISLLPYDVCDPRNIGHWPGSYTVIEGTDQDEVLRGGRGRQVIYGFGGNDVLRGGSRGDVLCGGEGDDRLYGGSGADVLGGGAGDDQLFGRRGRDILFGGDDNDVIKGGRGADVISGGDGDDTLRGGRGPDNLDGGAGFDNLDGGRGIDECSGGEVGSCEVVSEVDTDSDGIVDSADNCPAIANADQLDQYGGYAGDACEDSDGDGVSDATEANICVSVAGELILQAGTATCHTDPVPGLVAIADGDMAVAEACNREKEFTAFSKSNNPRNPVECSIEADDVSWAASGDIIAEAFGDLSTAYATDGSGKSDSAIPTASAKSTGGAESLAIGNGSSAVAEGDMALAVAQGVNGNTAQAIGVDAFAVAGGGTSTIVPSPVVSELNRAVAVGDESEAEATGFNNTSTATGINSRALSGGSFQVAGVYVFRSNNVATANGDDTTAFAFRLDGCTAEAPQGDSDFVRCDDDSEPPVDTGPAS